MTDRELLKLAAKAVGIKKDDSPYNGGGFGNDGFDIMGNMVLDWHNSRRWNPLTDDGDALRLAVQLFQDIKFWYFDNSISVGNSLRVPRGADPVADARRAIVRAAAEIGRNMK